MVTNYILKMVLLFGKSLSTLLSLTLRFKSPRLFDCRTGHDLVEDAGVCRRRLKGDPEYFEHP